MCCLKDPVAAKSWMTASRWMRLTCGVLGVVLTSGCSGAATLRLRDGTSVSGRIVGGDETTVHLERDGDAWDLERDEIVDVTHPGQGEIIAGGVLLGLSGGVLLGLSALSGVAGQGRAPSPVFAVMLAIPGIPLGIDGLATDAGSRSRYATPKTERTRLRPRTRTSPVPELESAEPLPPASGEPQQPPDRSRWCELRGCVNDPLAR
jgi:hypothetical protein